jgi:hypothetical protein
VQPALVLVLPHHCDSVTTENTLVKIFLNGHLVETNRFVMRDDDRMSMPWRGGGEMWVVVAAMM